MNCSTKFCTNTPQPKRKLCDKCRKRIQRANNPMKTAYNSTRNCALARGIAWNLTLEEFEAFAIRCKLLQGRGRTKEGWHVDRINEDDPRGYHPDNINKATNSENAAKENRRRRWAKLKNWLAEAGFPQIVRGPEILEVELLKSVRVEVQPVEHGWQTVGWLDKRPAVIIPDTAIPF